MRLRLLLATAILAVPTVFARKNEGGARGTVIFRGQRPAAEQIKMNAVDYCLQKHPNGVSFQSVQVGSQGGLANVFIYVKKGLEGRKFSPPSDPKVVLDQNGCWYLPRVLGIMVGQKLIVKNSDDVIHNVNAQPFFNIPTDGKSQDERVFDRPKVMQRLRCNIHSWMTGFIGIVDNPYYAVTDAKGAFEIPDLPPGTYTLGAWHEKLGEQTKEITVGPDGVDVKFLFRAKAD